MITLVGLGPGNPEHMTQLAIRTICEAEVLCIASRFMHELGLDEGEKVHIPAKINHRQPDVEIIVHKITGDIDGLLDFIERNKEKNTVIAVSGDPGFHSLLQTVKARIQEVDIRVVPGISSIQLLFSELGQDWSTVDFASAHGRSLDSIETKLKNAAKLCVLTDKKTTIHVVLQSLQAAGVTGRAVAAIRLSYPNQRIIDSTVKILANDRFVELPDGRVDLDTDGLLYIERESG